MTPKALRALADSLDGEGLALARSGDVHAATTKFLEAQNVRATADAMDEKLRRPRNRGTYPTVDKRERIDVMPSRLVAAAGRAGYSLRELAVAVGAPNHSYLSLAHAGKRGIKREYAGGVERITGFAATPENWPGGLKD